MLTTLLFIIFISSIEISLADGKSAKFGETCNKFIRCNNEGFLQCVSNVCQCLKPESMVYNEQKDICIALPGDVCHVEAIETPKKGEKFPEIVESDRNSYCGENGTCLCTPDYVLSNNRSCIPNKQFEEACSLDEDGNHNCRPDKYLRCITGHCACEEVNAFYDENRDECVAREGVSCIAYANCVPNAACPFRNSGNYYSSTLCTCQPGFSRSPEGLCLVNFGESCNTKERKCGHDMMCKSGRCECKYAERQTYDRDLNLCVSLVDSPCVMKFKTEDGKQANITFPCVKNAECQPIDALNECRCKEGYIEGDHTCELSYDQPCGDNIDEPCDRLAPLECIDGRCKCISEYLYYDFNARKCKALIGAPCTVGGSECKPTRNTISKYGQCRCTQGYLTTSGRKCIHHLLLRRGAV